MAEPLLAPEFPNIIKRHSTYLKSKAERKLDAEIDLDCDDMDKYAQPWREQGKEVIQGYMALALDARRNDNRSRLFPPVLHGIVYSRLSMEAAEVPNVKYKHRKSQSEPKMKWLNAALQHSETGDGNLRPHAHHLWFNQAFDKVLLGVGARYQTYLLQTREVQIHGDDGKPKTVTMVVHDDIWDQNLDPFHFGVSRDMLPGMFRGRACYFDEFYPRDVFNEVFGTPFYDRIDLVPYDEWLRSEQGGSWDVPRGFVRVRRYIDLYRDLFYVKANGRRIRKDFILDYGQSDRPKKFLPISTTHNDLSYQTQEPALASIIQAGRVYGTPAETSTQKSFWTMGDGHISKGMIAIKRQLWRAAADHVKASSVHFLLAKSAGVYDQIRTADLYGMVPLKTTGEDAFDVKSLTQGSDFLQKWVETDERIDGMVTHVLGNDWRRTATELTNEKATVAAIRQQMQRLRSAQNEKFNAAAVQRHYMIRLNLIQQYYVEPNESQLKKGEKYEDFEEKEIIRNADGQPCGVKRVKEIPVDEDVVEIKKDGKYKLVSPEHPDADGKPSDRTFKSREEYLLTEEEPETFVEEGSTFAELKALNRSLTNETLSQIMPFFEMAYPTGKTDPEGNPVTEQLIPKEGAQYVLEVVADVNEWDADRLLNRNKTEDEDADDDVPDPMSHAGPPPPLPSQQEAQQGSLAALQTAAQMRMPVRPEPPPGRPIPRPAAQTPLAQTGNIAPLKSA